jgi:hypothetical protein
MAATQYVGGDEDQAPVETDLDSQQAAEPDAGSHL